MFNRVSQNGGDKNRNRDGAIAHRRPQFERLERRDMLSVGNPLGEFLSILKPGAEVDRIPVNVSVQNPGKSVYLGIQTSNQGGDYDPEPAKLFRDNGTQILSSMAIANLSSSRNSLVIASLQSGDYSIKSTGVFRNASQSLVTVYLLGDVDGDGVVLTGDLNAIRRTYGSKAGDGRYQLAADANLDGVINSVDYSWALRNQDAGLITLTSATVNSAATVLLDEHFAWTGPSDGTLANTQETLSGWQVDTSGGYYWGQPLTTMHVVDTSTTAGVTLSRPIVKQTSGTVSLEFKTTIVTRTDGIMWQLRADGDIPVVKIVTSGDNLCYENSSNATVVLQSYNANTSYGIKVVANIDSQTADIYVNGIQRASGIAFRYAVDNVSSFYFKTSDSGTGVVDIAPIVIYTGYNVWDKFLTGITWGTNDWIGTTNGGSVGVQDWNCGASVDTRSVKLDDTSGSNNVTLSHAFTTQSLTTVWDYTFLLPNKLDGVTAELKNGTTTAVRIITSGGNICYEDSNGNLVTLWSNYQANLWYTIRITADPNVDIAWIEVNGKTQAYGVAFRNAVVGFDKIVFSTPTSGAGAVWVDDIDVYAYQGPASDYVPAPVVCASANYIVGVEAMPGWQTGQHVGWNLEYPYAYHDTYLGYYDANNPEAVDWQLKWMAEHGIDFFFDLWSGGSSRTTGAPLKTPDINGDINDGYFHAKYSNYVNFAIQDWTCNFTSADFRNNIVPYWIEYYFKDSRYQKIGGRPILGFGNMEGWISARMTQLGTDRAGALASLASDISYLRTACTTANVGNPYILVCFDPQSWSAQSDKNAAKSKMNEYAAMGGDAMYSYAGWSSISTDESRMQTLQTLGSNLPVLGTICSGFDDEAAVIRGNIAGYISVSDFQSESSWVKSQFLDNAGYSGLSRQLVMVDNWNEYTEGHSILPDKRVGFGYLDALRAVFTANPSHSDVIPTATRLLG
jgi:hypothetical protein